MKLSTVFTLNAVVAVFFWLGFAIMPGTLVGFYGASLGVAGLYVANLLGAAYLGYGVLTWMARNSAESEARRAVVIGQFVTFLVGLVFALIAQFTGVVNALNWTTVIIMVFFAVGYGLNLAKE